MSTSLKTVLFTILLLLMQISAFAGQAAITIVESPIGAGVPSLADICLSNGYHKVDVKGSNGTVTESGVTSPQATNKKGGVESMSSDT